MYPNERIKGAQAEKGLTSEQVAEVAGVNVNTVSAVRLGKNVKMDTLEKVASAVGLKVVITFEPREPTSA